MSHLTSRFDVVRGYPESGSALAWDFAQDPGATSDIVEGTVVSVVSASLPTAVDRHTSALLTGNNYDHPWIVARGKESSEAIFGNKLTCVRLRTGLVFKVATTLTPAIGSLLWALDGELTTTDPTGGVPHLGKVIGFDEDLAVMTVES